MGAERMAGEGKRTVLVCVCGGIAAYKACEVTRLLQKAGVRVKVLMTEHATRFIDPLTFRSLTHEPVAVGLFDDPADPIHHISLAQEADAAVIVPATANIMAKMATGLADDLMSTTLLATRAPIIIAPAMNTAMWEHPATQGNVEILRARGAVIVQPDTGRLACGDVGSGKLATVEQIARETLEALSDGAVSDSSLPGPLAGERVLITAGGTQEAIDPVRYIGNRSSGKMGYALARAARALGAASVTLISAPTALAVPQGVEVMPVVSAADMHEAVGQRFDASTMLVCAAAVADYTPVRVADHKLKKADEPLHAIELVETADILADMSARKGDRIVIGFAAETGDAAARGRDKLARKGCDAICANDVSRADSAFGSDTDAITWITAKDTEELPVMSKDDVAREILLRAVGLRDR